MKPYIAEVTWLDATRDDGEITGNERVGTIRRSIGWVLRSDSTGVIVAMTRDEMDGTVKFERGFLVPRAYVSKVRRL